MNLQIEKRNLIEELINLNDKEVIRKIKALLKKSSKTTLKPMSLAAFYSKIDESERAYTNGEFISQMAIEKEIATWKRKK